MANLDQLEILYQLDFPPASFPFFGKFVVVTSMEGSWKLKVRKNIKTAMSQTKSIFHFTSEIVHPHQQAS